MIESAGKMAREAAIDKSRLSNGERVYVAYCRKTDIASQAATIPDARANLQEAIALWLECASAGEIESRMRGRGRLHQLKALE